jgi:phosphohistidine phosphatase
LYLIQHGLAKAGEDDPERPLTDLGFAETERVAAWITRHTDARPARIIHSGKLRAQETADVFTEMTKPEGGCESAGDLTPNDDPAVWAQRLAAEEDDLMLVGHLPHLSRLVTRLLTGGEDREVVAFRNSGVVALNRDRAGAWTILWVVRPEMVA